MYLHQHGIPILSSLDPLLVRTLPLVLAARPAVALTVHDLQPLNGVTIRDAGMLPIVDDFVEGFAGRQC